MTLFPYSKRMLCLALVLLSLISTAHASVLDPLTSITIDQPVHFLASDGSDVVTGPGKYSVEPAGKWIRLIPGKEGDGLLIEAHQSSHELPLDHPLAMAFSGDDETERDHKYVILLLPGGQSLESTGTHSGIRPRGTMEEMFEKVKLQATEAFQKAQATARQSTSDMAQQLGEIAETQKEKLREIKLQIETKVRAAGDQDR